MFENLKRLKLLGKGEFGNVYSYQNEKSSLKYASKEISNNILSKDLKKKIKTCFKQSQNVKNKHLCMFRHI